MFSERILMVGEKLSVADFENVFEVLAGFTVSGVRLVTVGTVDGVARVIVSNISFAAFSTCGILCALMSRVAE